MKNADRAAMISVGAHGNAALCLVAWDTTETSRSRQLRGMGQSCQESRQKRVNSKPLWIKTVASRYVSSHFNGIG